MLSKEKIEKAKLEIYMVYSTSCDLLHSHILTVSEINDLKILLQYIQELEISNAELDKENNRLEKIEFERDMLKKGQNSLMSSRKKWKDRYYKLKAKNKKDIESWENVLDCAKYEINKREQENINLKIVLDDGLDKNKKYCFNEDGNTGKCLGYSNVDDDEPCEYCKTCEALSIKGDD